MFQADLDGGFGGALKDAGGAFLQNLGGQLSNKAEKTPDKTPSEDVSGAPTPNQKAAAGNITAVLGDAKNMMMIGGLLLGGMTIYLMASR